MKTKFYEIKNTKTQEEGKCVAANFSAACRVLGWKVKDCRCVWVASNEAAY